MSLEQSIAALTAQAGLLLDLPQTIANAAVAQINAVGAEYDARIANLTKTLYINQATGLDTNAGTVASPLRTIQKALEMTPLGGRCIAILQGAYTIDTPVVVTQRQLALRSDGTVRHAVNFTRLLLQTVNPNLRYLAGFVIFGNSSVNVNGLRLNIPANDGVWPGYSDTAQSALFCSASTADHGLIHVSIGFCDIDIPATPFGALVQGDLPMLLWMSANTLVGAVTSLNGKVVRGITATGATAVPNSLTTNLTTV